MSVCFVGKGEFPNEMSVPEARGVFEAVTPPARRVALSLSSEVEWIALIPRELGPDILHLGAAPERLLTKDVRALKVRYPSTLVMKSIPVVGEQSISEAKSYEEIADFLLLDSYRPSDKQLRALGVTHDWSISRKIVEQVSIPSVLAGGLGPENVAEAIAVVKPAGVDSKTRTDLSGDTGKDTEKVKLFVERAKPAKGSSPRS